MIMSDYNPREAEDNGMENRAMGSHHVPLIKKSLARKLAIEREQEHRPSPEKPLVVMLGLLIFTTKIATAFFPPISYGSQERKIGDSPAP